jgi:hypothetical protein
VGEGMWRRGAALDSSAASSGDDPPILYTRMGRGGSSPGVFSWSFQVRAHGTRWKAKLRRGAAWGKGRPGDQ